MMVLSVFISFGIAMLAGLIIAVRVQGVGRLPFLLRASLVAIVAPYIFKVLERINGDIPTAVDIFRDMGVLGLLIFGFLYLGKRGEDDNRET